MEYSALFCSITTCAVLLATPLILAALGELVSQKSGMINVGLEGYMLMGAMGAYLGSLLTGNPWLGVLLSIIAGLLTSLIMAYLTISLASDQIVCGIGINVLAWGFTSYFVRLMGFHGSAIGFEPIEIPLISQIPLLGPIISQQTVLTYLMILLVIVFAIILFRTSFGLRIKAIGEDPLVGESLGINVKRYRYLCVLLCGAMAGLGGSFYTLVWLNEFWEGITAGRGFIALASVIASGWNPYLIVGVCLLFAGVDGLALRLDIIAPWLQVPYPFFRMLPYILTIVVLVASRRITVPRALGVPYKRSGS